MKVYISAFSPTAWIIEPETEIEKQVLMLLSTKEPEGKYTVKRQSTKGKSTYTLKLKKEE